jgi:hypothetical protein
MPALQPAANAAPFAAGLRPVSNNKIARVGTGLAVIPIANTTALLIRRHGEQEQARHLALAA